MIRDVLDTHTHTLVSGHAYSTIQENIRAGQEKGLELLAITEHAPAMPGSTHAFYFQNFKVIPRQYGNMELLMGVELNILDEDGNVDMEERFLRQMDIAIASFHIPCFKPGTVEHNTKACINVMKNPYVNILGHPDDYRFPVDVKEIVQAAKEYQVLIEINNASLDPKGFRKNTREIDMEILEVCKEYQAPVVLGSDAHMDIDVGNHQRALDLLEEVHFPEELVVNRSVEELKKYANKYKNS